MKFIYAPFIMIAVKESGESETRFLDNPVAAQSSFDRLKMLPEFKCVQLYERKQTYIKPYGMKGNPK